MASNKKVKVAGKRASRSMTDLVERIGKDGAVRIGRAAVVVARRGFGNKKKMASGRTKNIRCGVFCARRKHGWETKPVPMRLGDNGCYSFLLPIKPTTQHKLFVV